MAPLALETGSLDEEIQQRLILSEEDKHSLIFIGIFTISIFILWNFPYLKYILTPFKLVVTGLHEFGHAAVGVCTGAKIEAIEIDVDTGGVTKMRGGNSALVLPAGYIGSSFFGGLMVFAGFDLLAAKIVSVLIGLCFLATLYWSRGIISRIISLLYIGLIAFAWWFEDSLILGYFVLFTGVMASLQSLWDFQGLLLTKEKVSESDPAKFAEKFGCFGPKVWAGIWMIISLAFMAGFAFAGVLVF